MVGGTHGVRLLDNKKYSHDTFVSGKQPAPAPPLQPLANLCHHRWFIPLLAAFGQHGRRFAVLVKRLGVAGPPVRRALDAAGRIGKQLARERPPRYDYTLTPPGRVLAGAARRLALAAASPS